MKSQHKTKSQPPQRTNLRRRRCKKQSAKQINHRGGKSSPPILPTDVITEIVSRLPANAIAKFRCVSKLWDSILQGPYIRELFLTNSSSRPQVLFAFSKLNELFFFSIPQLQNHDQKLSTVVATFISKLQFKDSLFRHLERCRHINGLVVLTEDSVPLSDDRELLAMICNPSTGQSLSVPSLKWGSTYFLGYDPIEKQYKLLSITFESFKILTIGSGNLLWRDILCPTEPYPLCDGICINGVIYYLAVSEYGDVLVSFDIRSEVFQFMEVTQNFSSVAQPWESLINYNGKLGVLFSDGFYNTNGRSKAFEIWVLEDPNKEEWSRQIHELPSLQRDLAGITSLSFVGVIGMDEIMLSQSDYSYGSYYVMYYNMKKKSVVRVEIKGMETCKGCKVLTFSNHVEDLKLLQEL